MAGFIGHGVLPWGYEGLRHAEVLCVGGRPQLQVHVQGLGVAVKHGEGGGGEALWPSALPVGDCRAVV